MGRFCGHCGARLDDDARVCGQCGTPVSGMQAGMPGSRSTVPAPGRKAVKGMIAVVVLAVVVIVAVNVFRIVKGNTGSSGLVREVMTAFEDYDIDTLVSLSSDMYYYGSEDYADNYFENTVGSYLDDIEDSVGHSYKISYTIEETYEMSTRKMDQTLENIEESFPNFDVDVISKIVVAEVKLKAKQDGKSISRSVTITMTRENDKWRLLYIA